MTTPTLSEIKATQEKLANMIASFEEQAKTQATHLVLREAYIELQPGERYAGLVLGDDGMPAHHLVLLPGQANESNWADAKAWAAAIGGELPTRREQALLFANLKGAFEASWYWSAEDHEGDGSCAWLQNFSYGSQTGTHKSYEGRARAVRRFTA